MRQAGMLLPVFSLPGKYGIGTLGKSAMDFVDILADTGNRIWQMLPMGPTGFGDSPYQSFSAFAENPYFLDLEELIEDGLLEEEDLEELDFGDDSDRIDYGKIYVAKFSALRLAFKNWKKIDGNSIDELIAGTRRETLEYCEFMAIKNSLKGASWNVWPEELRDRDEEALEKFRKKNRDEIAFYAFIQFKLDEQWKKLKEYAGKRGILLMGDIPIYCAPDSADAWAERELFQFDEEGNPKSVAGVPPDAFSATGQLWGNPLYDWEQHQKSGYAWWMDRMDYCLKRYDYLRVDHFRGFEAYYSVPFGDETAVNGEWVKGPGMSLFEAMYEHFGSRELPIIAEDLGVITDEVRALMKETGFPGMKILQFAFDSGPANAYLPHNFTSTNCICYTGTHDNDTLRHWFENLPGWQRGYIYDYMSRSDTDWKFMTALIIKLAMGTIADTVIIPVTDYLECGEEGRINQPGKTGSNWQWRMKEGAFTEKKKDSIRRILGTYGRYFDAPKVEKESEEASDEEESKVKSEGESKTELKESETE